MSRVIGCLYSLILLFRILIFLKGRIKVGTGIIESMQTIKP